jgi:hypothetical protein
MTEEVLCLNGKPKIYNSVEAPYLSLENLYNIYRSHEVNRVIYKLLSPNDNSKNQPYLAGHFTDIGFIPTDELVASPSSSKKTKDPKRQIKFIAGLDFRWLSPEGQSYPAPNAKLIYYPQFPEVRLSGFLQGSPIDMGGWMDPNKLGRSVGRVLFFGIRNDGIIFAYLATPNSRIANEIHDQEFVALSGVLRELPYLKNSYSYSNVGCSVQERIATYQAEDIFTGIDSSSEKSKYLLLSELRRIHLAGPISSKKLNSQGLAQFYRAQNGGGYTMEAELGVVPNGIAEPDFQGWEIKQFGVKKFHLIDSKVLTIMTPEPDGGLYQKEGVKPFMYRYGYDNAKIPDRKDFTGRHFSNATCEKSGLKMVTPGFDSHSGKMIDGNGYIGLLDKKDNLAASWSYAKLLDHWRRKHAKAAYIPSVSTDSAGGVRFYHYGSMVRLYEGTNIDLLLSAVSDHKVYYDPGIKMEKVSTKALVKKRSQFRIKSKELDALYQRLETVDVTEPFGN